MLDADKQRCRRQVLLFVIFVVVVAVLFRCGFADIPWWALSPHILLEQVSVILQLTYITKFFHWEMGYMNSMDIQHDRAGFYLCWGCLVSRA